MTSDDLWGRPDWTGWRARQQERGADHQPADLALPPATVNVSKQLLLEPPIGEDMLTTNTFRRCLVIVGSAQKLLVLNPGLRHQPTVEVARADATVGLDSVKIAAHKVSLPGEIRAASASAHLTGVTTLA